MPNFTGTIGKAYRIIRNGFNNSVVSGTYVGFEMVTTAARGTFPVHIFSTPSNAYSPTTRVSDYIIGPMSMFTIEPLESSENKNKATSENKTTAGTAGGRRRRRATRRSRTTRKQ